MRKLVTRDVFALASLVNHIGEAKVRPLFALLKDSSKDVEDKGISIIFAVMGILSSSGCESEAYALFAPIFGVTTEELAEMPIDDLIKQFEQLAEVSDLMRFFSSAVKLTAVTG